MLSKDTREDMDNQYKHIVIDTLLWSTLFLITACLGLYLSDFSSVITELWIANVVGIALLLRHPVTSWSLPIIGIVSAHYLAYALFGLDLLNSSHFAITHLFEIILVTAILKYDQIVTTFDHKIKSALILNFTIVLLAPALSATLGTFFFAFYPISLDFWINWFVGDGICMIIFLPVLLCLMRRFWVGIAWKQLMTFAFCVSTILYLTWWVLLEFPYAFIVIVIPLLVGAIFFPVFFSILLCAIQVCFIFTLYNAKIFLPLMQPVLEPLLVVYAATTITFVLPFLLAVFISILKKTQLANLYLTEDLYGEQEHLSMLLSAIMDPVIRTDQYGLITYMNAEAEKITGLLFNSGIKLSIETIFTLVDEYNKPLANPIIQALNAKNGLNNLQHGFFMNKNQIKHEIQYTITQMRDKNKQSVGAEVVFKNITQSKTLQDELYYNTTHDSLTGLLNRRAFAHILSQSAQNLNSNGPQHILCYLDLDFFKIVNDSVGHMAGDALLQEVAQVLQHRLRKTDVLARLGGDEFGIILLNSSVITGRAICQELIELVNAMRFRWEGKLYRIGMSIGMVIMRNSTRTAGHLLRDADIACYTAKTDGRNQLSVFEDAHEKTLAYSQEIALVSTIQEAMEKNKIVLYVQKIFSINSEKPATEYFEVLIRLLNDNNTTVSASHFVVVAERYNLMIQIDRWVITEILLHYDKKLSALDDTKFSINLSANSLNDSGFLPFLVSTIKKSAISPKRICFEITETAAMEHISRTIETVHQLQEMGCAVALDDFGVGLSSFNYIKNFFVDIIKIDGSFVKHIVDEGVDKTIVKTINDMAHSLGIKTVAEYVENQDILTIISELGVDYAQGFAIGKPVPLSSLIDMQEGV